MSKLAGTTKNTKNKRRVPHEMVWVRMARHALYYWFDARSMVPPKSSLPMDVIPILGSAVNYSWGCVFKYSTAFPTTSRSPR